MKRTDETPPKVTEFLPTIPAELLEECRAAESAISTNNDEVDRLNAKIEDLTASLPGLEEAVRHTAKVKANTLAEHAIDSASAEELTAARADSEAAIKAHSEAVELLSAVEKAHNHAVSKTVGLNDRKLQAHRKVWKEFHNQALNEIREQAGCLFVMAEVACYKLGFDHQGNPFKGMSPLRIRDEFIRFESAIFGR